tara:strand:+ start:136 stop:411 length:276 start_codon:yes stop_codon:yes gene_type:complete
MTKDEVIALAEKCKLAVLIHSQWTHEIREFTVVDYVVEGDLGSLMQFADLVANAEREACAKVVENILLAEGADVDDVLLRLAEDIRARGQA